MMATKKFRFPLRVENLLSQAGASVYSWYEEELEERLDPAGKARGRSDGIEVAGFLGSLAVVTYCLAVTSGHSVLIPALATGYVLLNWAFGRGFFPAPWLMTVVLSMLSISSATTTEQRHNFWIGISVGVAGVILSRLVMHAYREPVLVAFHIGAGMSGAIAVTTIGPGVLAGLLALAGGFLTGWVLGFFLQGRRAMSPFPVRLRPEQYSLTLPDPPTRLPFLLRRRARQFEQDGIVERKQRARSPEDAAIDIKKIGGAGERKTGLLLLGLQRGRWTRIVHDVDIPGATQGGNADHVILARSGGWVLDSKQFGSAKEPGLVRRTNTGEIAHVTAHGARDLGQTLRTVAWAVRGIRTEMQIPFRGLLVVHNAEVEAGLSVVVPGQGPVDGDVTVDVISAKYLIAYLDMAPSIMSAWALSAAHWGFQAKLVSATTGRPPQMVAPLGGGPSVMPAARPAAQERPQKPVGAMLKEGITGVFQRRQGSSAAVVHEQAETGDDQDQVLPADPIYPGEGPADMVDRRVRERWQQLEVSEPAAPDDVPDELRGLGRGIQVSHIGFTEDYSDVRSVDLVALSGPCHGLDGPFIWGCSPKQWAIHQQTGEPVMTTTFSLDGIVIRPEEGTETA